MESELSQYMRLSPYLGENLARYQPSATIPAEANVHNYLDIQGSNITIGSFISYNHYQPH